MAEKWMTMKEATEITGLSRTGVMHRKDAGEIKGKKDNRGQWRFLIDPEKVDRNAHETTKTKRFDEIKALVNRLETVEPAYKLKIEKLEAEIEARGRRIDELAGELDAERSDTRRLLGQIANGLEARQSRWFFGLLKRPGGAAAET